MYIARMSIVKTIGWSGIPMGSLSVIAVVSISGANIAVDRANMSIDRPSICISRPSISVGRHSISIRRLRITRIMAIG